MISKVKPITPTKYGKFNPYCYKALNAESYNALAAQVVTSTINASFFPKLFTIVVTPQEGEEEAFREIGKFIDTEGLSFHINPIILHDECQGEIIDDEVTPSCILQSIIHKLLEEKAHDKEVATSLQTRLDACEDNLNSVRKDKESYYKWWQEEVSKRTRLEESVKAFRTLLNAVVE